MKRYIVIILLISLVVATGIACTQQPAAGPDAEGKTGDSVFDAQPEAAPPAVQFTSFDGRGEWRIEFAVPLRTPTPTVFEVRTGRFLASTSDGRYLVVYTDEDSPEGLDETFILLDPIAAEGTQYPSGFSWAAYWPRELPLGVVGVPPSMLVKSGDEATYWIVHRQTSLSGADDRTICQLSPGEMLIMDAYPHDGRVSISRPAHVEPPPTVQIDPMTGRTIPGWQNERPESGGARVDAGYFLTPPISEDVAVVSATNPYTISYLSLTRPCSLTFTVTRPLIADDFQMMEAALLLHVLTREMSVFDPFSGPRVSGEALELACLTYSQFASRVDAELGAVSGLPHESRLHAGVWLEMATVFNLAKLRYSMTGDRQRFLSDVESIFAYVGLSNDGEQEGEEQPAEDVDVMVLIAHISELMEGRRTALWKDLLRRIAGAVSLRSVH